MDNKARLPPRDIVVIGGSQGSLDAVRAILVSLPAQFPAAILIALHANPSAPLLMAEILGRYSSLPVAYGEEGMMIEPGHVYLAPPDRHLEVVAPGVLHLGDGPKVQFSRPAADRLFETAAEVYGPRVVGLVLSGRDNDGTEGAKTISALGGLTFVQDPEEAAVPSMPLSTIHYDDPVALLKTHSMGKVLQRTVLGEIYRD